MGKVSLLRDFFSETLLRVVMAAALVMLFASNAQAQLGVNFGYAPETNTTNYTLGGRSSLSTLEMTGFFVGVNYNIELASSFGLSIGADGRYNTKTETKPSGTYIAKYTQLLVDIPVLLNLSLHFGDNARLTLFVGPTFSYALSGNTNYSENVQNTSSDSPWYCEDSSRRRLDILGTAGAAFTYEKFRVFGGYRMGLVDLDKDEHYNLTSSGVFVGLGYLL